MLLNTSCLPYGERMGPLLWSSYGFWRGVVLDVRANGAGVGLEARRRFCPPCGVGQWFISGRSLANLVIWRCEPGNQPSNQLRKFEILLSSSCCHKYMENRYLCLAATLVTASSRPQRVGHGPLDRCSPAPSWRNKNTRVLHLNTASEKPSHGNDLGSGRRGPVHDR